MKFGENMIRLWSFKLKGTNEKVQYENVHFIKCPMSIPLNENVNLYYDDDIKQVNGTL